MHLVINKAESQHYLSHPVFERWIEKVDNLRWPNWDTYLMHIIVFIVEAEEGKIERTGTGEFWKWLNNSFKIYLLRPFVHTVGSVKRNTKCVYTCNIQSITIAHSVTRESCFDCFFNGFRMLFLSTNIQNNSIAKLGIFRNKCGKIRMQSCK